MKVASIYGIVGVLIITFTFFASVYKLFIDYPFTPFLFFGLWLFFDSLHANLSGTSTITKIRNGKYLRFASIFVAGIILGLIEDFYGFVISSIWLYPNTDFSSVYDVVVQYGSWGFFLAAIVEGISFFRVLLIKKHHKELGFRRHIKFHWRLVGILGALFLILPIVNYIIFKIHQEYFLIFGLLGVWFVSDYATHLSKRKTVIEDIVSFNSYILSIIFVSAILSIVIEFRNVWENDWIYPTYLFCTGPLCSIFILFVGWVLWIISLITFYRAFEAKLEKRLTRRQSK